jgi:hypothetical protein
LDIPVELQRHELTQSRDPLVDLSIRKRLVGEDDRVYGPGNVEVSACFGDSYQVIVAFHPRAWLATVEVSASLSTGEAVVRVREWKDVRVIAVRGLAVEIVSRNRRRQWIQG